MSGPRASPDGILAWARELQAIAQNGLTFTRDNYDRERYLKLQELAARMLAAELGIAPAQAQHYWEGEERYATPKVDVRGRVFDGERALLVRERSDRRWTLPGGWVDVNDSQCEALRREIRADPGY